MKIVIEIARDKKPEKYFATSNLFKALKFWLKCLTLNIPKIRFHILKKEEKI